MPRVAMGAVLLLTLSLAAPAQARGLNNLYAGINGILTFPADPFVMVVTPPEAYEELPWHPVTGRLLAVPAGTLLSAYRLVMGTFDIAFTPFWVFPTMSPEARWAIIPDVEYE
ncbi:MAG: hypothetical protein ACE5FG_09730 [Myxococcota bacterium]